MVSHRSWMRTGAPCQAIYKGVEVPEWRAMHYQFQEVHQADKSKKSNEHALKEAKDKGIDFCDAGHAKQIQTRSK